VLLLYAGQRLSAGGVPEDVVGAEAVVLPPYGGGELFESAELIVLLPYGGGELEGAWLDELPPYGGGVLLATTELAEELPPYGGAELLDGRSVELLPP
jgi:hypothetical protein